jgi:hypothetical protein
MSNCVFSEPFEGVFCGPPGHHNLNVPSKLEVHDPSKGVVAGNQALGYPIFRSYGLIVLVAGENNRTHI